MDTQQAAPLGADDYRALLGMSMSDDSDTRAQAADLAKKLTPDERQAFFDFQQNANKGKGELTRTDNQIAFGIPPEAVADGVIGIVRGAGAVAGVGSKIAAGIGAVAVPQAKYWLTKAALIKMGVPSMMAEGVAAAVSGRTRGAKSIAAGEAEALPAAESAASAIPAATPVAPAETLPAPSAPSAPPAPPLVLAPKATAPALGKLKLSSDEWQAVQGLVKQGKPLKDVLEALQKLRLPEAWRNLPSDADVAASVSERNAKGKWPD